MPILVVDEFFMEEGKIFGFDVKVGNTDLTAYLEVRRREFTQYTPFSLGAAVAPAGNTGWVEVLIGTTKMLEPEHQDQINHAFFGVFADNYYTYMQYPANKTIRDLRGQAVVGGPIGWIDGKLSDYDDPDVKTEFLTLMDIDPPRFNGYNNTSGVIAQFNLSFYIMKYWTKLITDMNLIKKFETKEKKVRYITLGSIETITAPPWLEKKLRDLYGM